MSKREEERRVLAKTQASQLQHKLETEFHLAPRMAQAVVSEAQACLVTEEAAPVSGQRWVILASRQASHGQALSETATQRVCWTVDAGESDRAILAEYGRSAVRQVRIQRLVDEAIEQDAVATQEDLAQALEVDVRTIKRDCQALQKSGVSLALRGTLQSIGRGQSHKSQIVGRWLRGETYDQLMRTTHHHVSCIARYVQTFVRVVSLTQAGLDAAQIAPLLPAGVKLVQEYLALYQQHSDPASQERLHAHLQRLQGSGGQDDTPKKRTA